MIRTHVFASVGTRLATCSGAKRCTVGTTPSTRGSAAGTRDSGSRTAFSPLTTKYEASMVRAVERNNVMDHSYRAEGARPTGGSVRVGR